MIPNLLSPDWYATLEADQPQPAPCPQRLRIAVDGAFWFVVLSLLPSAVAVWRGWL